jgi:cytochrome c oxidase assembly factor CtaG
VTHWELQPSQLAPPLLFGVAYRLRARELAAKGRRVGLRRQVFFSSGLAIVLLALASPLDWYGENQLLWVHMIQHLLLGDIAPLLVVLGLSGPLLRPLLATSWLRRLRALAHPVVALPLWIVDLYIWHLPPLYLAALRHNDMHALEHFCFFVFGALMWAAVIEPLPGPAWFTNGWKATYTLVVRVAGTILANVFIWANHPFYSYYVAREHGSAAAAVSDQRAAGAIMFIEGSVVTLLAFAWLFIRWTRETEARQRLVDRDLDHAVASRAARYGRAARVRDVMRLPPV